MCDKNISMRGERSIDAQRKKRKEMSCNYYAQRGHFAKIALILSVGNVERKGMKRSLV